MTNKSIFYFIKYKLYLLNIEEERRSFSKGFRTQIAKTLNCQNAYISQVLNNDANLSLEQALKLSLFLKHSVVEEKYFLSLVEWERAGTKELKTFYFNTIHELQEKNLNIKDRVSTSYELNESQMAIYYSQWHYSAIHILVNNPNYQKNNLISEGLKISIEIVNEAILFLLSVGLLRKNDKDELKVGPTNLHLEKSSTHIFKHHTNWRIAAINSLANTKSKDIHYSTVSSLSKKDVEEIKLKFVQEIQNYVDKVIHSKDEELYVFNLDFFTLI